MHQYLSNSSSNKLFHRFKCYSWDNNQFVSSFSLLQSSFICWWKCQEQVRQCNSVFNIHAPPKEDNIWLIIIIIIHRLKDFMLGLHRVMVQNVGWNVLFRVVPVAVVIFRKLLGSSFSSGWILKQQIHFLLYVPLFVRLIDIGIWTIATYPSPNPTTVNW